MREQRPDPDPEERVVAEAAPGAAAQARFPLWAQRRGQIHVDAVWLRWRGPLGLVELTRRIEVGRAIDVVPNVRGVRSSALQFLSREALFGSKVQEQKGEGTEFEALRDYVPGLDSRFIDWKHSARHRKLLCKEFRIERNHPIVLAFDTGHLMIEPVDGLPRLDHAINAGLLLAWISLQGGDFVGLFAFDEILRQYHQPRRGVSNFRDLQRATSRLDYRHTETNFTLGARRAQFAAQPPRPRHPVHRFRRHRHRRAFGRGDAADCEAARGRSSSRLRDAVLHGFAGRAAGPFEDVANRFRVRFPARPRRPCSNGSARLGVHCLDVPSRSLPIGLINRYLLIKQRG